MFSWILALLLALVVWTLASLYLWLVRRRNNETKAGLAALAGLHWREFSEIVRRALQDQRGWTMAVQKPDEDAAPRSDFLMHDEHGAQWMVSCKHGRAYRMGAAAVNELGAALRLAGASGGLLITEGRVEREGAPAAERQSIEILDGRRIWPLLKPYLAPELENRIVRGARRRAQRHIGIAALASLTLGLLVGLGYLSSHLPEPAPVVATAAVQAPVAAPAAAPAPVSAPAPALAPSPAATTTSASAKTPSEASDQLPPASSGDALTPDPATLDRYQASVSRALAQTPGIVRGIWLTRMTLSVDREVDDAQAWPLICREVERYPVLRTVRIQLNPRPDHQEPVRWRQCSTI